MANSAPKPATNSQVREKVDRLVDTLLAILTAMRRIDNDSAENRATNSLVTEKGDRLGDTLLAILAP